MIITSDTRIQWSTLTKELERIKGAKNEFKVFERAKAEKENSGSMMNTSCTQYEPIKEVKKDKNMIAEVKRKIEALVVRH